MTFDLSFTGTFLSNYLHSTMLCFTPSNSFRSHTTYYLYTHLPIRKQRLQIHKLANVAQVISD